MNHRHIGALGLVLSLLALAAEIYALPLLQALEAAAFGSFATSPWAYAVQGPGGLALALTLAAGGFSLWLYLRREQ